MSLLRRVPVGLLVVVLGAAVIAGSLVVSFRAHRITVAPEWQVAGASAEEGRQALLRYGCASCHTVAGVREVRGKVGPPLTGIGERSFIAGRIPNNPENMVLWIQNPQGLIPGSGMPNLGVTERDAWNIAAYLYGLR